MIVALMGKQMPVYWVQTREVFIKTAARVKRAAPSRAQRTV